MGLLKYGMLGTPTHHNRAPGIQRDYELKTPVHQVIIHPNQGELISCDQSGAVKIW